MLPTSACRPAAKPAWLVVNAVAGQVLLGDEAEQLAVASDGGRVVERALVERRQAEAGEQALRVWDKLLQHVERGPLHAGRKVHVLAAVAGDAQLGQAENAHAGVAGSGDRGPNVPGVCVPRHRRLIDGGGG